MMAVPDGAEFQVPSRLDALGPLRAQVHDYAVRQGFDPDAAEDLVLCVHEALSNAIVHGHREDASLAVYLALDPAEGGLRVTVRDQGAGFDVAGTLHSLDEAGDQPRGRGMVIIRSLCDEYAWRDSGRELTFLIRP